jgi:fido (protein-threonine AMPylation protein)
MAARRTDVRRDSRPQRTELFANAKEKADLEARNGLLQFDEVLRLAGEAIDGLPFKLRPSTLQALQRLAIADVYSCAGSYRTGPVEIENTSHEPPPADQVPRLVEELCEYVNEHWDLSAIHLAAYTMWRVNWIHPFWGGNGRVSRAASYLVMCARSSHIFNGTTTVADHIVEKRDDYYAALDAADVAWDEDRLDVSQMETLLDALLAKQLLGVHDDARSSEGSPKDELKGRQRTLVARSRGKRRNTRYQVNVAIIAGIAIVLAAAIAGFVQTRPPRCTPHDSKPCSEQCGHEEQGFTVCTEDGAWKQCACRKASSAPSETPPRSPP